MNLIFRPTMNCLSNPFRPALLLLGFSLAVAGCTPDDLGDDVPQATAGQADFSKYVAVGNSLTAGFGDNGLYRDGQLHSYPSILAAQFAQVGGGAFVQPLFTEGQANGTGYLRLTGFSATGSPITTGVGTQLAVRGVINNRTVYTKFTDPVNNLGVPGIRMGEIAMRSLGDANAAGAFNALYERLVPDGASPVPSYLERVTAARPTFFTCWLGNNDVLGYATSGGALADVSAGSYGITDTALFRINTRRVIDSLTVRGAKGLVANIPNVAAIPFFNTVGPPVKASLKSKGVTQMVITTKSFLLFGTAPTRKTIAVTDIKDATGGRQLFTLTASPYAGLIDLPGGKYWRDFYAQLKPSLPGFITLSSLLTTWQVDTTKAFGTSSENPWPSTLMLDDEEQVIVKDATTLFNTMMRAKADSKGLAFFDANSFFNVVAANGYAIDGVNATTSYISGGLFSLDGVHPTPRGYALVANEIIRSINAKYGSTIQLVNPNTYRAVPLP